MLLKFHFNFDTSIRFTADLLKTLTLNIVLCFCFIFYAKIKINKTILNSKIFALRKFSSLFFILCVLLAFHFHFVHYELSQRNWIWKLYMECDGRRELLFFICCTFSKEHWRLSSFNESFDRFYRYFFWIRYCKQMRVMMQANQKNKKQNTKTKKESFWATVYRFEFKPNWRWC